MWDCGCAALGFSQQRCMSPLPGIVSGSPLILMTYCSKKLRASVVLLIFLNMLYMRRLYVYRAHKHGAEQFTLLC